LSNIADSYDHAEPDPEPHYFDAKTSPTEVTPLDLKGSVPDNPSILQKEPYLDTSLSPFVPVTPKDPYSGNAPLRLSRYEQPIDSILSHTFQGELKRTIKTLGILMIMPPRHSPLKLNFPLKRRRLSLCRTQSLG
jgi:hypothetical protein